MNRGLFVRSLIPAGLALCLAACSGSDGKNGKSCTVKTDSTGASTLVCDDGTSVPLGSAVIPKYDGGATNCTIVAPDGGAKKIVCPDGTEVVIPTTVVTSSGGATGSSCTVVSNGDGTSTMTCPGLDGGTLTTTIKSALSNFASLSADELAALDLKITLASVTIPASGKPVVAFKATDNNSGNAISGLPAADMRFALLKLVPATKGGNDTWVSYMAANATSVASMESAVATPPAVSGVLMDNGDGTYVYTFAKNVTDAANAGTTYDATATHRFSMRLSQTANGLQVFAAANVVKDFIPATGADVTGQNDKIDGASCLECHSSFRAKAGGTGAFHGGSIYDVRMCATCHNDQQRYQAIPGTGATPNVDLDAPGVVDPTTFAWAGNAVMINGEAFPNFPVWIHKIHMGDQLTLTGGQYTGVATPYDITYPQDVRNCDKCHRAPAAQAATFATKPSRRACGSCHDDVSFLALTAVPAGRTAHKGGPQTDDSLCATCHPKTGAQTLATYGVLDSHIAVALPDPTAGTANPNTNVGYVPAAGSVTQIPGAVVIAYNVKSVTRDVNKHPSITFRFVIQDGTPGGKPVVFNTYAAGTVTELMDGFVNSPSAYFAYALPQDGITAPADFNVTASGYIKNIWNGTATGAGAGTMTFDATTGYYTITLTGVTVPDSAVMLTGGIGYTYSVTSSLPLTQINLPAYPYGDSTVIPTCATGLKCGGLVVPALDVSMVATDATSGKAYSARRPIVANANCLKCHEQLGANPSFHAGQRNDGATCAFCHYPNRTSSGWSASSSTFIHGIHGASKRTVPFNWHAACPTGTSITDGTCTLDNADPNFAKVTYPGILNNCQQCHLPGTYDFSATASAAALPNLLMSTVATGTYTPAISNSPYVIADGNTDYGTNFSTANLTTGYKDGVACTTAAPCVCTVAAPCDPSYTTRVKSPITAACSTCHDSPNEITHMQQMGGTFYGTRLAAKGQSELCMMCHGPGTVAAIAQVHQ